MVEVLIAMAVMLVGVVGILQLFPPTLRAASEASLRGHAVLLAQRKAEEIRRDDGRNFSFVRSIRELSGPTELVPFPEDDRLAYQFSSTSLLSEGNPADPRDDVFVPRIIVRYNPAFRPSADILIELRFESGTL